MDDKLKAGTFPLLSTPENVLSEIIKRMALLDLNKFSLVSKKTKSLADMKSIQFPLLSTPKNALIEILKSLEMYYLVEFSLLSKKVKSLTEALNVKPMPIDIDVTNRMVIFANRILPVCRLVKFENPGVLVEQKKAGCQPKIDLKEYLAHVLSFTKQTTVRKLLFRKNLDETFLPTVFYCVPNCENVHIFRNVPVSAQRKILSKYRNATKQLILNSIPPAKLRANMVAQNFDCLSGRYITNRWMNLEDLLIANCAGLGIYRIDVRILNKFLKLWTRIKCNPRLEYLWAHGMDINVDMKTVLAGIVNKKVSTDTVRIFRHSKKVIESDVDWLTMTDTVEVRGGYDFQRKDGTIATVAVRRVNGIRKMEFFVWNCV